MSDNQQQDPKDTQPAINEAMLTPYGKAVMEGMDLLEARKELEISTSKSSYVAAANRMICDEWQISNEECIAQLRLVVALMEAQESQSQPITSDPSVDTTWVREPDALYKSMKANLDHMEVDPSAKVADYQLSFVPTLVTLKEQTRQGGVSFLDIAKAMPFIGRAELNGMDAAMELARTDRQAFMEEMARRVGVTEILPDQAYAVDGSFEFRTLGERDVVFCYLAEQPAAEAPWTAEQHAEHQRELQARLNKQYAERKKNKGDAK